MSLDVRFVLTMFVAFPVLVGLWRYTKVNQKFHPFIWMMCLELIAEIPSYISKKNAILIQLESFILLGYYILYFYSFLTLAVNFDFILKNKKTILFLISIAIAIINIVFAYPFDNLYYLLFYVSIVQLILSIDFVSQQIFEFKFKWFNNFWVWMGGSSIVFNAIMLLVFGLYFFTLKKTSFGRTVGYISTFTNAFYFLCSGIAILKIPIAINYTKLENKN